MTVKEIANKYEGYALVVCDADGCYWDRVAENKWSACGEIGWYATDAEVEACGIDSVEVYEDEDMVCIKVNNYLS